MLSEGRLLELLPFSRATLYRMIKNKKFPGGTFISPHRRVWYEAEIAAWQREVDGRRRGWDTARERTNTTETDA
jgi:predicted DNA-binding transcriptional regulator AlpA